MAETKISALPAVTTPASTDEFVVNQGGTTKKMTLAILLTDVDISASAAGAVPLQVELATTPTANAFEINTNGGSGGDLLKVSSGGALTTAGTIAGNYLVFTGDTDTGFGNGSGDEIEITAGAVIVGKFDTNATAGNTRMLLYDVDNGQLERVSVGAADSGGSGFKVLRIPN